MNSPEDFARAEDITASSCRASGDHKTLPQCESTSATVKIVTVNEAREIFGRFVHKIPGVAVSISVFGMIGGIDKH